MEPDSAPETVKAAYRRAARETHPDLVPTGTGDGDDPTADAGPAGDGARFLRLSDALRVLESDISPVSLRRPDPLLRE